jgi:hypothetical protein
MEGDGSDDGSTTAATAVGERRIDDGGRSTAALRAVGFGDDRGTGFFFG